MERLGAFLGEHPETGAALQLILPALVPPVSYATCAYNSLHAFGLVNEAAQRRYARYRLVPDAGETALPEEEIDGGRTPRPPPPSRNLPPASPRAPAKKLPHKTASAPAFFPPPRAGLAASRRAVELVLQAEVGGDPAHVADLVGEHEADSGAGAPARPVRPMRWT